MGHGVPALGGTLPLHLTEDPHNADPWYSHQEEFKRMIRIWLKDDIGNLAVGYVMLSTAKTYILDEGWLLILWLLWLLYMVTLVTMVTMVTVVTIVTMVTIMITLVYGYYGYYGYYGSQFLQFYDNFTMTQHYRKWNIDNFHYGPLSLRFLHHPAYILLCNILCIT